MDRLSGHLSKSSVSQPRSTGDGGRPGNVSERRWAMMKQTYGIAIFLKRKSVEHRAEQSIRLGD